MKSARTLRQSLRRMGSRLASVEDELMVDGGGHSRTGAFDQRPQISEEFRTVLELFEFHGESYEDIAEQLDLPIGTVRSRLFRARAMLRRGMESAVA